MKKIKKIFIRSLVLALALLSISVFTYSPSFFFLSSFHQQLWVTQVAKASIWKTFKQKLGLSGSPNLGRLPPGSSHEEPGRSPLCVVSGSNSFDKSVISIMFVVERSTEFQNDDDASSEHFKSVDWELDQGSREPILEDVGGLTTSEQPTFWFYIPYVVNDSSTADKLSTISEIDSIRLGKFILLDEDRELVSSHLMAIALSDRPQLVPFKLPFPLEIGKTYGWHFSIICEPEKPSRNPVVRGWVQRVEPSTELTTALENAQPNQRHLIYAENGIWFETVTELIETRRRFPNLYQPFQDWEDMLAYFELIDSQPIDFANTEPVAVKADSRRQSQLPARM